MDVKKRIEELLLAHKALSPREAMLQLAREIRDAAVAAKVESVTALVSDRSDRKGLSDEWDQIDDDIKKEVIDEWQECFARAIRAAIRLPGDTP